MSKQKVHGNPPHWRKRILLGFLWTLSFVVTVWTLIADPPHLEFWPTVAFLTVVALGIAIPVSIERKHQRKSNPDNPETNV